MYYANRRGYATKKKIPATLVTLDGEVTEGYFFAFGYERITDALNRGEPFVTFEAAAGVTRLVERDSIARIELREDNTNPAGVA